MKKKRTQPPPPPVLFVREAYGTHGVSPWQATPVLEHICFTDMDVLIHEYRLVTSFKARSRAVRVDNE